MNEQERHDLALWVWFHVSVDAIRRGAFGVTPPSEEERKASRPPAQSGGEDTP